ncbi:MAG: ABC transporter substrate-binding protein [Bacillaceae bacterium]
MKKKIFYGLTAGLLSLSALAGCSSGDNKANTGTKTSGKTIDIFQLKVEIDEPLKKLAKTYEKETGVKVNVRSVGGGSDYGAALKAEFQSGKEPDLFIIQGAGDLKVWQEKLDDLSGETWVKNAVSGTLDNVTVDNKIYGMPVATEGYGLIYNKSIFEKAGIDPKTIDTLDKLKAATETLNKKKKELGIEYPISYTTKEAWVTGNHTFNIALAQQKDPKQFVEDYKAGKADIVNNAAFKDWMNLVDVLVKDSDTKNLDTIDYNTQLGNFATGKAAMLHQGNWTYRDLKGLEVDFDMGFIPLTINNDVAISNRLAVGVPMYWAVNKDSKDAKETKEFLNWMVTNKDAQNALVNEMYMIPAFTNFNTKSEDPLANSIMEFNNAGKTIGWPFTNLPDGFTMEKIGPIFSDYAKGSINQTQMLEKIQSAIK